MVREGQTIVRMSGWDGGWQPGIDDLLLEADESPDVLNVDFGVRGEAVRRDGFTQWSTSDPGGMLAGVWLARFTVSNGDNRIILVDSGGAVWDVDSDSGSGALVRSQFAGPTDVDGNIDAQGRAQMNDTFYLTCNIAGDTFSWDGVSSTSWVHIVDNVLDGNSAEFPLASALAVHADRMWAGSVGTTLNSLLHYSDLADPDTWQANNFFDVGPDQGTSIQALKVFQDTLLIFKLSSIFQLSGLSEDSFVLRPLTFEYGTEFADSVVVFKDRIMWFDRQNGVMSYDGADFEIVDLDLGFEIVDTMDFVQNVNRFGAFGFGEKYYLSGPDSSSINVTFVYDLKKDRWTKYDFGAPSSVERSLKSNVVLGTALDAQVKGLFEWFDGLDDNSAAISSSFKTPWFSPEPDGSFMDTHRLLKMIPYFTPASGPTPVNVTVELYANFDNNTAVESKVVAVDEANSDQVDPLMIEFEDTSARAFQVKFTHATAAENWQLNAIDFLFLTKPTVSGVR